MLPIARPGGPVTLIGRPDIIGLYSFIITALEQPTVAVPAEGATLKGLTLIQEAIRNE
jgi:hypothetical protein